MKKNLLLLACVSACLLVSGGIASSQPIFGNDATSLRCGYGLVSVGDSERRVIDKCGTPTRVTRDGPEKILIYYFGTSRFKNYVSIVNGRVHRIQSGPCDGDDVDCQ